MKVRYVLSLIFLLGTLSSYSQTKVAALLCENRPDPLGIDAKQPGLSWQLLSDARNVMQTAYEIRVSEKEPSLLKGKALVWETGKVNSDSSVHVFYKGAPLSSGKRYYWQVRVWDNSGKPSLWSAPAFWQMGMLAATDWKAQWISPAYNEDIYRASPLFRKTFTSAKKIRSAVAYITAHGLYEAEINGQRIGDAVLTPGWTSYNKRLQYQVYDVTSLLKNGNNTIGATLGNGWYRGVLAWNNSRDHYGKDISLLLQVNITYKDGSTAVIATDDTWKAATGPILYSEIYNGETYDARLEKTGWTLPIYNDSNWGGVTVQNFPLTNLIATINEPVKKHETFKAVRIFKTPKGEQVIDFGQNVVGWVQAKLNGKPGERITISHAEILDKAGNFYTDNLRGAKEQDVYILKGDGPEVFSPHFTWQGFRFIKVEGNSEELKPEDFTAVALYSDMKPTGSFSTSNALLNQLQHNIQWGQKGNFLDVPTDCPQRDERLGWTGDAQVFSRTASFNMNVDNFFAKWLKDVAADQGDNGSMPFVIPALSNVGGEGATGWADVSTIIPWNMYLAYGDKKILADQYTSMKKWVGYMQLKSKNDLWNTGPHFGDWLFYSVNDDNDGSSAITSKYLIAQCFWAYSTQLVINAAKVLGKPDDVAYYTTMLGKIKAAFLNEYVTPNGSLLSDSQTAYVLALQFDMLPEKLRPQAVDRLVDNIVRYRNHLTTGFLGTPYLCHVLSRFGRTDVAYRLLLQDTYPSWLYPVKMGATTIWERWDGIRPDGSLETPTMNSYNHYAYGAIGDWMYRVAAGLDTYEDGTGYKHIRVMPHIGGSLTNVSAQLQTYYGMASSAWSIADGKLQLKVSIPPNTKANIFIPAGDAATVMEGSQKLSDDKDIHILKTENGYVEVEVGSGNYVFIADYK
ncbi:alpha-L-rhamnosidase [uncultured Mucilaginibacter sp.]|uniref:alpha-L-rhamnosidase n=1 Tax=uncultured Mucilaginibacter sp. TaxID=797541 RepID=UPI0025D6E284|nr:alpha-L-rhamnosidase [uncultured Mucilaginibacter sp.]